MKTIILLLSLACMAANAADERFTYTTNVVPDSGTFRIFNGEVKRLTGSESEWVQAQVLEVRGDGAVVQIYKEEDVFEFVNQRRQTISPSKGITGYYYQPVKTKTGTKRVMGEKVFVRHYTGKGPGSDYYAETLGTGTTTNIGSLLRVLDYGIPTNGFKTVITTNWHPDYVAKQRDAQTLRVIAYQLAQASNGLPSFQTEVAKRYLNGDGLEKNMTLALHWLNSACTNRDSQASNLLMRLKSE
jgi:hypothetical protein